MSLSNSRHQFLAFESQNAEEIQYGRKGGIFVTTCVCIAYIFCAVIVAALVGTIVYFITYFKLSQKAEADTDVFDTTSDSFGATPSADLRLPSDVVPSSYRLKLRTDLDKSTFKGEVYITIKAKKNVKEIILHSKGLSIINNPKLMEQTYQELETKHKRKREAPNNNATSTEATTLTPETVTNTTTASSEPTTVSIVNETVTTVIIPTVNPTELLTTQSPKLNKTEYSVAQEGTHVTHTAARNIEILSVVNGAGDRLMISLATALKPDLDYTLEISFEGNITDALTGFYKNTYRTSDGQVRHVGVTQFEPTSARAAFPCFDEPAFKAMFEISIAHRSNLTALSNMKVASEEDIPESPGWKWTHFERSVKMSTYLVAYVISDFRSVETSYISKDNVTKPIRVWARPELINKAQYALNITPRLLEFYEDVFGLPYALDKLDLIAIPEFSSGAMENWGLITFRETTLLFDAKDSARDKQNVAIDVAHELAHQWFGNLVTMRWWTDLWLNEGFATYIEFVGVDRVEPEWSMFETFSVDKMDLLRSDALKNTSPVSRQVVDASEISQKFDEISYTKGANLIRMLNHTVSEDMFFKGLLIYLNDWKYSNAEENDLWLAISKATASSPELADLSVVELMNSWTRQAGYPVLRVHRDYTAGEVTFEQKLFTSANTPYPKMAEQIWHVPISFSIINASTPDWSSKPKLWLKERSIVAKMPLEPTQALYVNVDAIGYYRVNYDSRNWEMLATALKTGYFKSPIPKAQLIDDAFNLAKSSQLNYSLALGLTTCVIDGEDSKIVWDLLLNNMGFLKHNIRSTSGYLYFQDYIKIILQKQLERLNFGLDKPVDDIQGFLIEGLVSWECEMESPRCLSWARRQFEEWAKQPNLDVNIIPSHLRSLVFNMALRHGGRKEFDIMWKAFNNATDPNIKDLLIGNLPLTREESLIAFLLEKSLTDLPSTYAMTVWAVEPTLGARVARDFLLRHFDAVYEKFSALDEFAMANVLSGAFGFITTTEELDIFKAFARQHKEKLVPLSNILHKIVDTATLRIEWINNHAAAVGDWFKKYVTEAKAKASTPFANATRFNNETEPTVAGTGNATEPSVLQTGNATEPKVSRTGNATEPKISRTGNATEPKISRTGNATEPTALRNGNATETVTNVILPGNATETVTGNVTESRGAPIKETSKDHGDKINTEPKPDVVHTNKTASL